MFKRFYKKKSFTTLKRWNLKEEERNQKSTNMLRRFNFTMTRDGNFNQKWRKTKAKKSEEEKQISNKNKIWKINQTTCGDEQQQFGID